MNMKQIVILSTLVTALVLAIALTPTHVAATIHPADTGTVTIVSVDRSPTDPMYYDTVTVTAHVTDSDPTDPDGVDNVTIYWSVDGGPENEASMTLTSGDGNDGYWEYTLPAYPYGSHVTYYVVAKDYDDVETSSSYDYYVGDDIPPTIVSVDQSPTTVEYDDDVIVTAHVTEPTDASGVDEVTLHYTPDGGATWYAVHMALVSGDQYDGTWQATIPAYPYGTTIEYYVSAIDYAGNSDDSSHYTYTVVDLTPPEILSVVQNPAAGSVEYDDSVTVTAHVTEDTDASGVSSVTLWYSTDGGATWNSIAMTLTSGTAYDGYWEATIPAYPYDTEVWYYIEAEDVAGNTALDPPTAPANYYSYTVDDFTPPVIDSVVWSPSGTIMYYEDVEVSAHVTEDTDASGVSIVELIYSTDGGVTWNTISMTRVSGDEYDGVYNATIPNQPYGTTVYFYIRAVDVAGNEGYSPTTGYYMYEVNGDDIPPEINSIITNVSLTSVMYYHFVEVTANITEDLSLYGYASGIDDVYLYYSTDDGTTWNSIRMTLNTGDEWNGTWIGVIPRQPWNTHVMFYIEAFDKAGNVATSSTYEYIVGDDIAPSVEHHVAEYWIIPYEPRCHIETTIYVYVNETLFDLDAYPPLVPSGIESVVMNYTIDDGVTWTAVELTMVNGTIYDGWWSFTLPVLPWNTTVRYYFNATDRAGNFYVTSEFEFRIVDVVPPEIIEVSYSETVEYDEELVITLNLTDSCSGVKNVTVYYGLAPANLWYTVSSNAPAEGTIYQGIWNVTIPPQVAGNWVYFRVYVFDREGLNSTYFGCYYVADNTPPVIDEIWREPEYPEYMDTVIVYATVMEPETASGVAHVYLWYKIGDAGWASVEMEEIVPGRFKGVIPSAPWNATVEYYIEAVDNAGNSVTSVSYSYTVRDTVPPIIISISHIPSIPNVGDSVDVTVMAYDAGSGIDRVILYYKKGEGSWIELEMTRVAGTTINGTWRAIIPESEQTMGAIIHYKIKVIDRAGNEVESTEFGYSVGDYLPPDIEELFHEPEYPEVGESVTVKAIITDVSPVSAYLYYWDNVTETWSSVEMTQVGEYYQAVIPGDVNVWKAHVKYYVVAVDINGNNATSEYREYFVRDTTAPSISNVVYEPSTPTPVDNVTVTATVTDGGSGVRLVVLRYNLRGVWYEVPMENIGGNMYRAAIPAQKGGTTVEFEIVAYDYAGNDARSTTYMYTVSEWPSVTPPPPVTPTWPYYLIGLAIILIVIVIIIAVILWQKRKKL